jgi:hypothetical protein
VPVAPAASRALWSDRTHTRYNEYTGTPGIPARNGFNGVCRALPSDRAFLPLSSADQGFVEARLGSQNLRELDASVGAPGPHDFAVRRNVPRPPARVSLTDLSIRPAIPSRARRCRVHRIPHPTSVTIAKRPFVWDGMADVVEMIWGARKPIYFFDRDWTAQIRLRNHNKSPGIRDGLKPKPAARCDVPEQDYCIAAAM